MFNLCLNISELGTMRSGGFAEYVSVPARLVHKFYNISMDEASNVEPAGNGYHTIEKADIQYGDKVLIIGPGPIGLYALQFAKLKYPEILIMIGTKNERLKIASELGATHVFNVNETDVYNEVMRLTNDQGINKVIQCATTDHAHELAIKVSGRNSTIVIEGLSGTDGTKVKIDDLIIKPTRLIGANGVSSNHFQKTLKLLEMGLIDAKKLITHKKKLIDIVQGYDLLMRKAEGVLKIVVNP
jgi:L-iditol 2-dehydrogenase